MKNLTYFCKKMETDVDPRLSSTLAYSDLQVAWISSDYFESLLLPQ